MEGNNKRRRTLKTKKSSHWWERGIIYQIYPFSFMDSDGDGIGDLEGVIDKLDYLNDGTPQSLGVDGLWFSPFHPSPWKDYGYDVSDYTDIHPRFGNLDIFDRLVSEAHRRGIKIILDFVPNHTSSQHPWFVESRSSRDNPKRDWYIWHDARPDGGPPTSTKSNFVDSSWTRDELTGQYYFHKFFPEQPDLNWRNREVREAMFGALRFWLDRGVDGFRFDAVHSMIKEYIFCDQRFHDDKLGQYMLNEKEFHEIFREIRSIFDQYGDRIVIGETWTTDPKEWVGYFGKNLDEFHIPFNFLFIGRFLEQGARDWRPLNAEGVRKVVEEIERMTPRGAWPNYVLGNHDIPRLATRYGPHNARLAAMLLLTLRGTPILYYGDEIGMQDVAIPESRIRDLTQTPRDPARTPMRWDSTKNAGFSSGAPWLPVGDDYKEVNVANQLNNPNSLLALYRKLVWLRRKNSALSLGSYRTVEADNPEIFAYVRRYGRQKFLIALNFSDKEERAETFLGGDGSIVVSTELDRTEQVSLGSFVLRPHEGCIIKID